MRERLTKEQIVVLDVLLVPKGVVLPAEAGVVVEAATVIEAIQIVLNANVDDIPVIHISDKIVLDIFNKHASAFPLAIAMLDEIPGGEYDVAFNNYTHMLPSISIGELLEASHADAADINLTAQSKLHGRKGHNVDERVARRSDAINQRVKSRSVAKAPIAISLNQRATGTSQDPMADDIDLGDSGQE